jgi:hypothetical protein
MYDEVNLFLTGVTLAVGSAHTIREIFNILLPLYALVIIFSVFFPLFRVPTSDSRTGFKTYAGSWHVGPDGFTLWIGDLYTIGLGVRIYDAEVRLEAQFYSRIFSHGIKRRERKAVIAD